MIIYYLYSHSYSDSTLISFDFPIQLVQIPLTNLLIDLRIQQRNGRKTLTTVQGLPKDIDQKKLLKAFKKDFACNGTIVQDEELGEVIQMQGDQRQKAQQFLADNQICTKDKIKVHGF